jgi:hypothetical protein
VSREPAQVRQRAKALHSFRNARGMQWTWCGMTWHAFSVLAQGEVLTLSGLDNALQTLIV